MSKVKFKNILTRDNLYHCSNETGQIDRPVIKWRLNNKGEQIRKVVDFEPVYEKIQAERDAVDLQAILRRYEEGDATALDKVHGMYIDTADLPKTYADMYRAVQIHNDSFNSMPIEIKEQFDNNPAKFWSNFGTEEFDNIIREYRETTLNYYGLEDENPIVTVEGDINGMNAVHEERIEKAAKVGEDNER